MTKKKFCGSVGSNFGEGKPTPNLPNSGFGGTNPLPTAEEIGSVGGGWVGLAGSLDSPNYSFHLQRGVKMTLGLDMQQGIRRSHDNMYPKNEC